MFDSIGPKSPFVFIGFLDFSFALIFIAFMCSNKGKDAESSNDDDSDDESDDQ